MHQEIKVAKVKKKKKGYLFITNWPFSGYRKKWHKAKIIVLIDQNFYCLLKFFVSTAVILAKLQQQKR